MDSGTLPEPEVKWTIALQLVGHDNNSRKRCYPVALNQCEESTQMQGTSFRDRHQDVAPWGDSLHASYPSQKGDG